MLFSVDEDFGASTRRNHNWMSVNKLNAPSSVNLPQANSCRGAPACGKRQNPTAPPIEKARDLGVPIRDYKKTKIILMGTPASEYRKESSNFSSSLCVLSLFLLKKIYLSSVLIMKNQYRQF